MKHSWKQSKLSSYNLWVSRDTTKRYTLTIPSLFIANSEHAEPSRETMTAPIPPTGSNPREESGQSRDFVPSTSEKKKLGWRRKQSVTLSKQSQLTKGKPPPLGFYSNIVWNQSPATGVTNYQLHSFGSIAKRNQRPQPPSHCPITQARKKTFRKQKPMHA